MVADYSEWFFCVYSVWVGWCGVWLWWGLVVWSVGLQGSVYGSLGVSVSLYVSLTVSVVVEGLMRVLSGVVPARLGVGGLLFGDGR